MGFRRLLLRNGGNFRSLLPSPAAASSSAAATTSVSSSVAYPARRTLARPISSTSCRLDGGGWFDKIKGVFTGNTTSDASKTQESFSLVDFADQMDKARKLGSLKQFVVGRCSEATISSEFQKQSAIIRYLGSIDPTGENLQSSHKQDAAKHCNCTITDVENALAKYMWAKDAQKKIEKLKEEGKPMPKSFSEVQKLMGSTPLNLARSNLAKSGQLGRNALCPCGSNKKYKSLRRPPSDVILFIKMCNALVLGCTQNCIGGQPWRATHLHYITSLKTVNGTLLIFYLHIVTMKMLWEGQICSLNEF